MKEYTTSFRSITTFKVGGSIKNLERPDSALSLITLINECDTRGTPVLLIGGGSNIVPRDESYDGTVVIPVFAESTFEKVSATTVRMCADAGASWDAIVKASVERELWGIENLSAIPGTVGAAPIQNIGAYGTDVAHTIEWVEVYDRFKKKTQRLDATELLFGYRTSLLKKNPHRFVVVRVSFLLSTNAAPRLAYKDLTEFFKGGDTPDIGVIRDAVIEIRKGKFPDLRTFGTAGSFFMNPVVSQEESARLSSTYPEMPRYPGEKAGTVKLSLAWILDHVVHAKGMRVGGACVWEKQPLVIATDSDATARDVHALAMLIQEKVYAETNITIVPEVTVL